MHLLQKSYRNGSNEYTHLYFLLVTLTASI